VDIKLLEPILNKTADGISIISMILTVIAAIIL